MSRTVIFNRSKCPSTLVATLVAMLVLLCPMCTGSLAQAQLEDLPEKREDEINKLRKEFQEFSESLEKEIAKREKQASLGRDRLNEYREELVKEFRELTDTNPNDLNDEEQQQRKNIIRLQLWELKRLEPNIEATIESAADLQQKVTRFVIEQQRKGRGANPILAAEIQQLYKRIVDINRRQRTSRARSPQRVGFFVVNPDPSADDEQGHGGQVPGEQNADERERANESWGTGPLQQMQRPLKRILRLRWNGETLALDRNHWDALFGGKELATISKMVRNQLAKRGVDLPPNERFGQPNRIKPESLALLVENLRYRAAAGNQRIGSTGYSNKNGRGSMRFETDTLSAAVGVDETQLDFETRERDGLQRTLRVTAADDGRLRIVVFGQQAFFLEQKSDGRIVFFESDDERTHHQTADSFLDFYAEHPQLVEETIFPFLEHHGVIAPEQRHSPAIVARVVDSIRFGQDESKQEFQQLLLKLDDADFEVREAASKRLKKEADRFIDFARSSLAEDTLSLEAATRVKRVIDEYDVAAVERNQLIDGLGLLEDVDYLTSLLDRIPQDAAAHVKTQVDKLQQPQGD